jgi:hypothetical protein
MAAKRKIREHALYKGNGFLEQICRKIMNRMNKK